MKSNYKRKQFSSVECVTKKRFIKISKEVEMGSVYSIYTGRGFFNYTVEEPAACGLSLGLFSMTRRVGSIHAEKKKNKKKKK